MADIDVVFKALGDPIRIRIVQMLARNGEMCVCKIMEELDMSQPAVSHHLASLKNVGLVRGRKEGQWVHYSLSRDTLTNLPLAFLRDVISDLEKVEDRDRGQPCCPSDP